MSSVEGQSGAADGSAEQRESEERLRLIQAAARIGSFDWNMVTKHIFRSPEYLALHGLPPDAPLTGVFSDAWLDRVHPDDREQVAAWARADMAAPAEFAREYRIVRADTGEVRWLYNRGRVVGDASGRPVRMVSAQTDITDRKLGELRSQYMAGLSDALRRSTTARDAMRAACEQLGRYLKVSLVGFGEVDETESFADIHVNWSTGEIESHAGRHRFADFHPALIDWFKSGQPIITEDSALLASMPGLREAAERFGARSGIDLPLLKDGKLVAILGVHHHQPRRWAEHDIATARITAERTRDAIERARAEEALRAGEERMRLAVEGTGLGFYDFDLGTGEGVWSETTFALLGMAVPSDLSATVQEWRDRIHPDDLEPIWNERNRAVERGGLIELETRIVRADDGATRWVTVTGRILGPPEARRSVGVVLDITERKQEELRQAFLLRVADRLRGAPDLRAATDGVAELLAEALDVDTVGFLNVDLRSQTGTVMSGYSSRPEPPLGRSFAVGPGQGPLRGLAAPALLKGEPFVVADVATDVRTRGYADVIKEQTGASAMVLMPVMRGERLAAVLFAQSALPRVWDPSEVSLVAAAAGRTWDAIERLRAEAALRRANDRLAGEVERAVTERESALAQLHQAQKLETIGQLTGGIAHDFNNLLTPITGALDLLRHRFQSDERLERLIGGALQSAERARVLVQRLLGFARRQPLQPVPVDLGDLLRGMQDLIASSVGRGIKTGIEIAPGLPPALADSNQLELAVLNLCVNARDAMPDGGTLTIRAEPADAFVRITVADTGFGMDEDTLARAIEPFFSTKSQDRGTGLGLSMVHGLMGQLGGSLEIESAPGEGTCVALILPIAAAPAAAKAAHAAPVEPMRPLSILLVDDEDLVRAGTAEMLRDMGHEVDTADSGSVALAKFSAGTFDLIVTDYMMPGMDGVELASRVAEARPGQPVLLITGFIGSADKAKHLPRLDKPFGLDELAAAVQRVAGVSA